MDKDLRIMLTADLDIPKSVADINKAIDKIQSKISKLRLDIDTTQLKNAQVSINGLTNSMTQAQMKIKTVTSQQAKLSGDGMSSLKTRVKEIDDIISKFGQKASYQVKTDAAGNVKSATIKYVDATGKMINERMKWQQFVNKVMTGNDPSTGKKQFEYIKQNVFKTTDKTYTDNIKKIQDESDKLYKKAVAGRNVAGDGKTFLNQNQAKDIEKRYKNIMNVIDGAANQNRLINNQELKDIQNKMNYIDRLTNKYKNVTNEIKRQQGLGERLNNTDLKNVDYKNYQSIKQSVADQYNSMNVGKKEVKAEDVVIKKSIVNSKTQQQVADFEVKVATGKNTFDKYRGSVDQASKSIYQFGDGIQQTANKNLDFMNKFKSAMQSIPIWMAGMTAFYQTLHFFTDGVAYVNEMNKALTELSIVFMQSQGEVAKYGAEFKTMAQEMSISALELAQGAVEFARQGLGATEMMEKMRIATMYAKISNIDFNTSAKILTATVNSMGVDAEHAADVFSYMGDATATGADEIGRAMQKLGGSAGSIGLEFEKAASWVAVVSSRTRESAETIGNSVKSIIARVQSLKERGFDEVDGTQLNQVTKAMAAVGIQATDASGNFRNFGDVMDELGAKWEGLTVKEKAYIATTVAGSYQQSRFLNIMEGYPESVELYEKSMTKAGIAQEKFNLYQQGTEAHLTRMKEAWNGVFQSSFDSPTIQAAIDILGKLGHAFDTLVSTIGLLPLVFGLVTTALLIASGGFQAFYMLMGKKMVGAIVNFRLSMQLAALSVSQFGMRALATSTSTALLGVQLKRLAVAGRMAMAALMPMLVIGAIGLAIGAVTNKVTEHNEALKAQQERMDKIKKNYSENRTAIDEMIEEYKKLNAITSNGTVFKDVEEEEKYFQLTSDIAAMLPNLVKSMDDKGRAHLFNADAMEKELKIAESLANQRDKEIVANAKNNIRGPMIQYAGDQISVNQQQKKVDSMLAQRDNGKNSESFIAKLEREKTKLMELEMVAANSAQAMRAEFASLADAQMRVSDVEFSEPVTAQIKDIANAMDVTNPEKSIDSVKALILNYEKFKTSYTDKTVTNAAKQQNEAIAGMKDALKNAGVDHVDELVKGILKGKESLEAAKSAADVYAAAHASLDTEFQTSSEKMAVFNKLLTENAQGKALSADEVANLIKEDKSLINLFKVENGIIKLNTKAVQERRKEELQHFQEVTEARKKDIEAQAQAVKDKLKGYGILLKAEQTLQDAIDPIDKRIADAYAMGNSLLAGELNKQKEAIREQAEAMENLEKEAELYASALGSVGSASGKTTEYVTELQKAIDKVNAALDKNRTQQGNYAKSSQQYRDAVKDEIKLLKEKREMILKGIDDPSLMLNNTTTSSDGTPTSYAPSTSAYNGEYDDIINKYASKNGVDPRLVAAIIQTESTFDPNAKSSAGAMGLMQLMPKTAKGLGVKNAYDPEQNIAGGTKHIADLLKKYNGNVEYALAAYNAGSGNVSKWIKNGQMGNIPTKETREYAPKVLANYNSISGTSSSPTSSNVSGSKLDTMLSNALGLQSEGFKYKQVSGKFKGTYDEFVKGATSDCSQFVQEMFDEFLNINLPRTAAEQSKQGTAVDKKDLQKGDLVFFETKKGEQASHVGIYTGNGKFIQMGDHGLKEQSLDSSYWEPKYRSARRIDGVGQSSTGDASTYNPSEKEIYDFQQKQESEVASIDQSVIDAYRKILDSETAEVENKIAALDSTIKKSEAIASRSPENSSAYRKQLEVQKKAMKDKQKLLHDEAEIIRKSGINSDDLTAKLNSLSDAWWELDTQISDITFQSVMSKLDELGEKVETLKGKLDFSSARLVSFKEGTKAWRKELSTQISLTKQMQSATKAQADAIRNELKGTDLTPVKRKELETMLTGLSTQWWVYQGEIKDIENTILDNKKQQADEIIQLMKDMYAKQKEMALEAIETQSKALEKAHKDEMKRIEDEQDGYENLIQAKIRSLEDMSDERTYDQDMEKRQQERQEVLNKIGLISMDNSSEAKSQLKELNKRLSEIDQEIENARYDRNVELEKQALQDELDASKKRTDQLKEDAEFEIEINGEKIKKKYEDAKDALDAEKEVVTKYYDELINDERRYAEIRKQIVSGNTQATINILKELKTQIDILAPQMGDAIANNFTDKIKLAKDALLDLSDTATTVSMMMANSEAWFGAGEYEKGQLENENDQLAAINGYTKNKKGQWVDANGNVLYTVNSSTGKASNDSTVAAQMKANSEKWASADAATKKKLEAENQSLGKSIGATYKASEGAWYKNGVRLYHKGGIIGGSGNKQTKLINKLFNAAPNEQVIMALQDELAVPSENIAKNFLPNMSKFVSNLMPNVSVAGSQSSEGMVVNINIGSVTGDEKGADIVTTKIMKEMKKLGVKLR